MVYRPAPYVVLLGWFVARVKETRNAHRIMVGKNLLEAAN